ncbi:MAG: DUF6436 domain-containing protein [Cellvibrionaceae bacterium]
MKIFNSKQWSEAKGLDQQGFNKSSAKSSFIRRKAVWLVLCLLIVFYFLVYFAVKHLNNLVFQTPVIFSEYAQVESILSQELSESKNLSVVYIWERYCPCNWGVNSHYSSLFDEYSSNDIDFYVADLSAHHSDIKKTTAPKGRVLSKGASKALLAEVQYVPAIAVMSENNELLYYGPHSLGFVCNAETSIVSKVISSLKEGVFSKNTNVIGEGCFCAIDNH